MSLFRTLRILLLKTIDASDSPWVTNIYFEAFLNANTNARSAVRSACAENPPIERISASTGISSPKNGLWKRLLPSAVPDFPEPYNQQSTQYYCCLAIRDEDDGEFFQLSIPLAKIIIAPDFMAIDAIDSCTLLVYSSKIDRLSLLKRPL